MNSTGEPHPREPETQLLPWEGYTDPNTVRMYPDDPMKELRRLRRRAENKGVYGRGSFGRADVEMMVQVENELGKKLRRLAFLEKTAGDMKP